MAKNVDPGIPNAPPTQTTQRAYTASLSDRRKHSNALWATHSAVNRGVNAAITVLLTLRGGIDDALAQRLEGEKDIELTFARAPEAPPEEHARQHAPTIDRVRWKRLMIAHSWLTVESLEGAPEAFIVARGSDESTARVAAVQAAFTGILARRGTPPADVASWLDDCGGSLAATIREDAAWVNRSAAFDVLAARTPGLDRTTLWDLLERFYGAPQIYLADPKNFHAKYDKPEMLTRIASGWLTDRFGEGKKTNWNRLSTIYSAISEWAAGALPGQDGASTVADLARALRAFEPSGSSISDVLGLLKDGNHDSHTRHLLSDISMLTVTTPDVLSRIGEIAANDHQECLRKIQQKGASPLASALLEEIVRGCGIPYRGATRAHQAEYATIIGNAARRSCSFHSFVKNAEHERLRIEAKCAVSLPFPPDAEDWMESYCALRASESGTKGAYLIRPGALRSIEKVFAAWEQLTCNTAQARIDTVKRLQASLKRDAFGDARLFIELASDDAAPVRSAGLSALRDSIRVALAREEMRCRKVPMLRHPDALRHPVFCDFGSAGWNLTIDTLTHHQPDEPGSLRATVWDGVALRTTAMQWRSRRLVQDFQLCQASGAALAVSRANGLGRVAQGLTASSPVFVAGFDRSTKSEFGCRLQAPREQLDRVAAHVAAHGWDPAAHKLLRSVDWYLSVSPKFTPALSSPWKAYLESHGIRPGSRRDSAGLVLPFNHPDDTKGLGEITSHQLSRLPGLTILSTNLGCRNRASCAVWRTISSDEFNEELRGAEARGDTTTIESLFATIQHRTGSSTRRSTYYRRIGADHIEGGTPHPAPWARLIRLFPLTLPGEQDVRKASPSEFEFARSIRRDLGYARIEPFSSSVSDLMAEAIRTLRRDLRRHADVAKAAYNLTATTKQLSGGRVVPLRAHERSALVRNALRTCRSIVADTERDDAITLVAQSVPSANGDQLPNDTLILDLAERINAAWSMEDAALAARVAELRSWIIPSTATTEARHTGGLSIRRLSTIDELHQLLQSFLSRPNPTKVFGIVPNPSEVQALDPDGVRAKLLNLRDDATKQLAHEIVSSALGVDPKTGERSTDSRFPICQAIVIEDLAGYVPKQEQPRRENQTLTAWRARATATALAQLCEEHGLHLRTVPPAYISRVDCRTGLPGLTCSDVPLEQFLHAPWWRDAVRRASRRVEDGRGDPRDGYLVALDQRLLHTPTVPAPPLLRILTDDGEIFLPAESTSPAAHGIHRDLNAAANVGLGALTDPDWEGAWWHIFCSHARGVPDKQRYTGALLFTPPAPLPRPDVDTKPSQAKKTRKDASTAKSASRDRNMYLWSDRSVAPFANRAWIESGPYWTSVAERVLRRFSLPTHE